MPRKINDAVTVVIGGSLLVRRVFAVTDKGEGMIYPFTASKEVSIENLASPWTTVGRYEPYFPNLPFMGYRFVPNA